jgi:hypothetical protein
VAKGIALNPPITKPKPSSDEEGESVARKSLANFPQDFLPLTIICGDRRGGASRTRGDIFVAPASTTDLTFLLKLGLPPDCLLKTDKSFARMTEDEREKVFGRTNLLMIGSPMVNLASRFFNQHSLFRFAIDRDLMEIDEKLRKLSLIDNAGTLQVFWDMAMNPQKEVSEYYKDYDILQPDLDPLFEAARQIFGRRKPTSYIERFASETLIDFTTITGAVSLRRKFGNDFAILSLGRNPFAVNNDYVCIMAAGIGGTGTAHAVRVLSEAEKWFVAHPFGGIFEVSLNMNKHEHPPSLFEKATVQWYTKSYSPKSIRQNLEAWLQHDTASQMPAHSMASELFDYLTVKEIEECLRFVQGVSHAPAP